MAVLRGYVCWQVYSLKQPIDTSIIRFSCIYFACTDCSRSSGYKECDVQQSARCFPKARWSECYKQNVNVSIFGILYDIVYFPLNVDPTISSWPASTIYQYITYPNPHFKYISAHIYSIQIPSFSKHKIPSHPLLTIGGTGLSYLHICTSILVPNIHTVSVFLAAWSCSQARVWWLRSDGELSNLHLLSTFPSIY